MRRTTCCPTSQRQLSQQCDVCCRVLSDPLGSSARFALYAAINLVLALILVSSAYVRLQFSRNFHAQSRFCCCSLMGHGSLTSHTIFSCECCVSSSRRKFG